MLKGIFLEKEFDGIEVFYHESPLFSVTFFVLVILGVPQKLG